MRLDLQHANEYIRGNTLRFVTKLNDAELIEPLLAPARQCLEHRHAYVRKNAVFAVASIFKSHEHLIPDAPELILNFLNEENDVTAKRNAFAALESISPALCLTYLSSVFDSIQNADELLALVYLEFIRGDASKDNGSRKPRYLRLIFELLEAKTSVSTRA
jgi:coatomer subunit beta